MAPATVLDSAILSGLLKPREAGGGALREGAEVRAEGEGREGEWEQERQGWGGPPFLILRPPRSLPRSTAKCGSSSG